MAEKPKFDPSKPFEVVNESAVAAKPKFDPSKPFIPLDESTFKELEDQKSGIELKAKKAAESGVIKSSEEGRAFIRGLAQGGTFNFGDEIQAAIIEPWIATLDSKLFPGGKERAAPTLDSSYEQRLESQRRENKQAQEKHPIAFNTGELAGVVGSTAGITPLAGLKAATTLGKVGVLAARGGVQGGLVGALSGAGASEGGVLDRLKAAGTEGTKGAAIGAIATPAVTGAIKGISSVAGKSLEAANRLGGKALEYIRKNQDKADEVLAASKDYPKALAEKAQSVATDLGKAFDTFVENNHKEMTAILEKHGDEALNGVPFINAIDDEIAKLDLAGLTDEGQKAIGALQRIKERFTSKIGQNGEVTGKQINAMKQSLFNLAKKHQDIKFGDANQELGSAANNIYGSLRAILQGSDEARPAWQKQIQKINQSYAEAISDRQELAKMFGARSLADMSNDIKAQDVARLLEQSTSKRGTVANDLFKRMDQRFGTRLLDEGQFLQAAQEAAQTASSGLGKYPTGFSLASPLAGGVLGALGGASQGRTPEETLALGLGGAALGLGAQSPVGRKALYKLPAVEEGTKKVAEGLIRAAIAKKAKPEQTIEFPGSTITPGGR